MLNIMEISDEDVLRDLHPDSPNHKSIVEFITANPAFLARLNFTVEQYHLTDIIQFDVNKVELAALHEGNYNLLLYLKTRGTLECNLQDTVNNLGDRGIVTIYNPTADYSTMINKGFIPCPLVKNLYKSVVEYYLQGMNEEEITFWTNVKKPYKFLSKNVFWSLVTMAFLNESALKGDSYPILFFNVNMLYSSMRPRNDMSMFQTPNSNYYNTIGRTEWPVVRRTTGPSEGRPAEGDKIPVVRYSTGMSRGLFYGERPDDVCGYFYYYEPESTTFLKYNTVISAFNKTEAIYQLVTELDERDGDIFEKIMEFMKKRKVEKYFSMHSEGKLPKNLLMTAEEYSWLKMEKIPPASSRKVYTGVKLGLYADEDDLDQKLCSLARYLGYDIVILTNMIGSHQVVTEVLDTRGDSFSHLWFKK